MSGARRPPAPSPAATTPRLVQAIASLVMLAVSITHAAAMGAAPSPPSVGAGDVMQVQGPAPGRPVAANVRLMYFASSASFRSTTTQFVWRDDCDPSVEDCWIDPATGRTVGADVEIPTPAGAGYTQVDILYVDDAVCLGRVTSHLVDVMSGALLTMGSSGFVSAEGCADFWLPQQQLAALAGRTMDGLRARRGPYTLAGRTFDALSIVTSSRNGTTHNAYEADSGLLMVATSRTLGAPVQTIEPGGNVRPAAGGSMQTYSQFLGIKTLDGGPPQRPLPPEVATVQGLTYTCSVTTALQGVQPLQSPCRQDAEVVQRAPGWLVLRSVRQLFNPLGLPPDVSESVEVITNGGLGGPYASVEWLQGLTPGAILDDDTITGIRFQVTSVDQSSVVIEGTSQAQRITYVYDRPSGWMRTAVVEQVTGPGSTTTIRTDLQEVR
jgi:hypothetical protein